MRERAMVSLAVLAAMAATVPFELHAQGGRAAQPATSTVSAQPTVPIVGIAQVTFKTSDIKKALAYYDGVLGFRRPSRSRIRPGSRRRISRSTMTSTSKSPRR